MTEMVVEKSQALHHPRIEPAARMPGNLAYYVEPILEPAQFAAGCGGKDRGLAILTLITELRYVFAIVSESRLRVVW
jgi:hypothetical protein